MISIANSSPRIALVGCGAIAEKFYLPALARHPAVMSRLVLVDSSLERAKTIGRRFHVDQCVTDYRSVLGNVDGAIVATPHKFHFELSNDFLKAGSHVLCEKPLTETRAEGEQLIASAALAKKTISVNNTRRLFPSSQKIHAMVAAGELGTLRSIRFHEGGLFAWPTASGFYFASKNTRGVLLDRGAHALDLICWWLGGKPTVTSSENDSYGGSECVSFTRLTHEECECDVRLSWLSKLDNVVELVGDRGSLVQKAFEETRITWKDADGRSRLLQLPSKAACFDEYAYLLMDNFLDVIADKAAPLLPAELVLDSLQLINECYDQARRFEMPWDFAYDQA